MRIHLEKRERARERKRERERTLLENNLHTLTCADVKPADWHGSDSRIIFLKRVGQGEIENQVGLTLHSRRQTDSK